MLAPKTAIGPVSMVVGKSWLAYSCRCASIQTQVLLHFFFHMDPLINEGGPDHEEGLVGTT